MKEFVFCVCKTYCLIYLATFCVKKKCHHLHLIPLTQLVFSFSCAVFITLYCHILHSCRIARFFLKKQNNKAESSPEVKLLVGVNSVVSIISLRRKCLLKDWNFKATSLFTRFQILKSEEKFEMFVVWSVSKTYLPLTVMKRIIFVLNQQRQKALSELKSRNFLSLDHSFAHLKGGLPAVPAATTLLPVHGTPTRGMASWPKGGGSYQGIFSTISVFFSLCTDIQGTGDKTIQ